ncbi:MAG: adenosylcobinamide amidohydrolase [Deltaproteobacteria bacterium]|nr:adenosylcobinamide amidohydrolase [Deltaproteobacteria bacterium]
MLKKRVFRLGFILLFLSLFVIETALAVEVTDELGRTVVISGTPKRIVSISPEATEIILALGAGRALRGVSTLDSHFPGLIGLPAVGSPEHPHPGLIRALKPDLLIADADKAAPFLEGELAGLCPVLFIGGPATLGEALARTTTLGVVMRRPREAKALLAENEEYFQTLAAKVGRLGRPDKPRVLYLTSEGSSLASRGADSYQAALIRAAGGEPWTGAGGRGAAAVAPGEIAEFNPDLVFTCGPMTASMREQLGRRELRRVGAASPALVRTYPCALADRGAAHLGYFAAWLSSALHADEYGDPANMVNKNEIVSERKLPAPVDYVERARVVYAMLNDYVQKTLLIDFKTPQTVISTSDGQLSGIRTIGNGSSPVMVWDINHRGGWEADLAARMELLGLDKGTSALMFTGADMDNLAAVTKRHLDLTVTALATAGAESNAVRSGKDEGAYYEPGTINVIVLSSRRLSEAGAARAMITATEAKTAALWDLGVRSSQTPLANPATGTGTDSLIVVAGGSGKAVDYTGAHGKIGQLISEAVYEVVLEALANGNGLARGRSVFVRLAERGLDPAGVWTGPEGPELARDPKFQEALTLALLEPEGASLLETAFALDDALGMSQLRDGSLFLSQARRQAARMAGLEGETNLRNLADPTLPPMLKIAFDALGTGLAASPAK